jgi:hypothetical protein
MKATSSNHEIEETLQALDGIKRAEVGVDFQKQVMQKVSFLPKKQPMWLKYCAAVMLLMLLFNSLYLLTGIPQSMEEELEFSENFIYQSIDYTEFE